MNVDPETGKMERESSDARDGDDGGPPGAVKRAWSRPRVRVVVLSNMKSGIAPGNSEWSNYNPDLS